MLAAPLSAQEDMPAKRQQRVTQENITARMVEELQLDEKQQKKVAIDTNGHHLFVGGKEVK